MDLKWLPIIRIWFKDLQLFPICRIRLPRITRNFQNLQSALAILWESCCLLATAWWVIVSPEGAWCSFKSYPILLLMKAAPSIDNVPFSSVAFILYKHQTDFFWFRSLILYFNCLGKSLQLWWHCCFIHKKCACVYAVGKMQPRINVYNISSGNATCLSVQNYFLW